MLDVSAPDAVVTTTVDNICFLLSCIQLVLDYILASDCCLRMVLVTTFLLLRELHNWLSGCGESEKQSRRAEDEILKLRTKYRLIDNTNNDTLKWLYTESADEVTRETRDVQVIEREETELLKELSSVRAVLEMREEELRKLRWKLDRTQVICDVKHIQTQTEESSAVHKALIYQNQYDSDLGQRGWSVT